MLTEKIKKDELEFMEVWNNPIALSESLFNDFDNLGDFDKEKFGRIRLYQLPFMSYESMIDTEVEGLSEKEQFQLRKNVGDCYNLGARKYGKSLITIKLDIVLSALNDSGLLSGFYSIDEKRLRGILDPVKLAMEYHPICKLWEMKCTYKPAIIFYGRKNKWLLNGINLTLKGKTPGEQFYQLHVKKLWGDEVSFETQEVFEKRKESLSEVGAVIRLSGMTNFVRHSPIGKTFYAPENQEKLINLPQFVNPFWDEAERLDRIKVYGGEDSINYRVFVKGEVVEDGISELDMEQIQKCYQRKKTIKSFEIPKKRFSRFRNYIVVDRPKNADRIFISADVGDTQTEIIIHSEIGSKYNYLYNITLYNLKNDDQEEIFRYLIDKLQANVVAIDCGEAFGRILCDHLEKKYKKENIVRYAGASKIVVGFQQDNSHNIILEKGKPIEKKEYMSEWSIARLKVLLYGERVKIPMDYKLDMQFSQVVAIRSGTRVKYKSLMKNDHLFNAWRPFCIAQWLKKDFNMTPKMSSDWGTGASSWSKPKNKETS